MNAKAFAIAIFSFALPFATNAQETCNYLEEDENNCSRFVGCINEGETLFKGTSRGWGGGTLYGETTTGSVCQGTWTYDARIDKGEGSFVCEDGEAATISFFARGETVSAITGVAITKNGKRLRIWGSPDLSAFFAERYPDAPSVGQMFKCGDVWMPLPTTFPDKPQG